MKVVHSKLTTRGRTTLPKDVRKALRLKPGDTLAYRINRDGVTLARAEPIDRAYLKAVESTLTEWESEADKGAYKNL